MRGDLKLASSRGRLPLLEKKPLFISIAASLCCTVLQKRQVRFLKDELRFKKVAAHAGRYFNKKDYYKKNLRKIYMSLHTYTIVVRVFRGNSIHQCRDLVG